MADTVVVVEVAGSWSYTVIPDGALVGTCGWADSEDEAWLAVNAVLGVERYLEPPTDEACPDCKAAPGEACHVACSSRWS